jgi:hypothetical protein
MDSIILYSNKSSIPFELHLENLEKKETKELLIKLREFAKSQGSNVIEEIRPHRIVYAKSLTFRYFLDIQPMKDVLIISIRKGRKEQVIEYHIKNIQELENMKPQIVEAYINI